jgi:L-aspartate oxidase
VGRPRRAGGARRAGPPAAGALPLTPPQGTLGPTPEATHAALWRDAGLERDAAGLARLLHEPHPLARLVGACGLAREETRGAHVRRDRPATDPAFDLRHIVVEPDGASRIERWT